MFIARQPIFNKDKKVYGYELLYRVNNYSKEFDSFSPESATATVINGLFIHGLSKIVDNKKAFINFDTDVLFEDFFHLINSDSLVLEILEDVVVTNELVNRISEIKSEGYKIALDDFIEDYSDYPLVEFADIIKFDIIATPLNTIRLEVLRAKRDNKILLAEKIETRDEYTLAKRMGFQLFQGYFFCKPEIIEGVQGEKTINPNYLRILDELQTAEPSYQVISEIIEGDVNLTYKLLRTIDKRAKKNSIYSIKRALTYLGLKELNYWITLLLMQDLSNNKPEELLNVSLIRSKFASKLSNISKLKRMKLEASLMGLLSNIDAFLDMPIENVLKKIKVTQNIKDALLHGEGVLGDLLNLIIFYEKGNWDEINKLCNIIDIDSTELSNYYFESVQESSDIVNRIRNH